MFCFSIKSKVLLLCCDKIINIIKHSKVQTVQYKVQWPATCKRCISESERMKEGCGAEMPSWEKSNLFSLLWWNKIWFFLSNTNIYSQYKCIYLGFDFTVYSLLKKTLQKWMKIKSISGYKNKASCSWQNPLTVVVAMPNRDFKNQRRGSDPFTFKFYEITCEVLKFKVPTLQGTTMATFWQMSVLSWFVLTATRARNE